MEFVNDCEKKCFSTQDCNYYQFDCKLSVCSLKRLDTTQENNFIQNDRYITGTDATPAAADDDDYHDDDDGGDGGGDQD